MSLAAKQQKYWNNLKHQSMPDKLYVELEVKAIKKLLGPGNILDVGCGDGENTGKFATIKNSTIIGIDYAPKRIKKAKKNYPQLKFICLDLSKKTLNENFDYIVSQRFLINLPNWQQQKTIIKKLISYLKPNGKLILCEGSIQGNNVLNKFRSRLKLSPIPIHWHNRFLDDNQLKKLGFSLTTHFGGFFLLTRGVRPFFNSDLNWNCRFNRVAMSIDLPEKYSRIKVWQFIKDVRNNRQD